MALSKLSPNPVAFQDLSFNCMMVWCFKVRLGGVRAGVFRGWPCRNWMWVPTQEVRYLRYPCMLSSRTKP